jgi:purine-cytosine permease-like protein
MSSSVSVGLISTPFSAHSFSTPLTESFPVELVFLSSTWLGLIIPLIFTELLDIAIITAIGLNVGENKYPTSYDASGNGGLIAAILKVLGGFGNFCLIILALSIIAKNCPNIYSVFLTLQVLSRYIQIVPGAVWTFLASSLSGYR